jgi:hypothetical protein
MRRTAREAREESSNQIVSISPSTRTMIEKLGDLIAALRDEMQQFGELLARLDHHHDRVLRRAADDLLQSVSDIQAQGVVLDAARRRRADRQSEVARKLFLSDNAALAELVPLLPENYRPLVGALARENSELLIRVQQRSHQNHLLLARTLEMMQRFMSTLVPDGAPVAGETGGEPGRAVPVGPLIDSRAVPIGRPG